MSKENKQERSGEKKFLVGKGVGWDFFKRSIPDFLNDPWEQVETFIEGLPFGESEKIKIAEKIRQKRDSKMDSTKV